MSDNATVLSRDEAEIISKYRKMDERGRRAIFQIVEAEYAEFLNERDSQEMLSIKNELSESGRR